MISPVSCLRSPVSLKIVFVGHVDHGKSTLIGRILEETGALPEGKLNALRASCKAEGRPFEYAFVLDALAEEQQQNVTIDTTQIQFFRTAARNYVIIDAPGHEEFLKNMITGAASADAAVIVIAADEGAREQSRRHGKLLSLLGIRQVIVAVNNMDLANYSEPAFQKIKTEYGGFLEQLGIDARAFVPVSARMGVNVAKNAEQAMGWFHGPTVLRAIDEFEPPETVAHQPLRFPVQDVYRMENRRVLAGRIESGTLRVGDQLLFSPHRKTARVATIERWPASSAVSASAGISRGLTLRDHIFIERGHIASHEADAPVESNRVHSKVFWISAEPLRLGARYRLKLVTQNVECEVVTLLNVVDVATLNSAATDRTELRLNEVGEVTLQTRAPLVLDNHARVPTMGRFVLTDGNKLVGGGVL